MLVKTPLVLDGGHDTPGARGLFVQDGCGALIEMMAGLVDFVVLDAEHGDVEPSLTSLLRAGDAVDMPCLVRIPRHRRDLIGRVLDLGAAGIVAPGIQGVEEAQEIVQAARYAPDGARGVAFVTRAAGHGRFAGPQFMEELNRKTVVLAQVETSEALAILPQLVAIPGLSGLFVGPTDLSVALGQGSLMTDVVSDAIMGVKKVCDGARMPWGIFAATHRDRQRWDNAGANFLVGAVASLLRPAISHWAAND